MIPSYQVPDQIQGKYILVHKQKGKKKKSLSRVCVWIKIVVARELRVFFSSFHPKKKIEFSLACKEQLELRFVALKK